MIIIYSHIDTIRENIYLLLFTFIQSLGRGHILLVRTRAGRIIYH